MKTENTDLLSDEQFGGPAVSETELQREFVRPTSSYSWKGHELWPLCNGGEILFNSVIDGGDSNMACVLIWIFIYMKRGIPVTDAKGEQVGMRDAFDPAEEFELHLVELCWNKVRFRGAFLRWLDGLGPLTTADKKAAVGLFDDMHGWSKKSAVVPVKTAGQKKSTARSRSKSRSSSNSSRKSRGSGKRSGTSSGTSRK